MNSSVYVIVMVGVIGILVAVIVPALFLKKCPMCLARNSVDATACRRCGAEFPENGRPDPIE